jgi:hypothetical protein
MIRMVVVWANKGGICDIKQFKTLFGFSWEVSSKNKKRITTRLSVFL